MAGAKQRNAVNVSSVMSIATTDDLAMAAAIIGVPGGTNEYARVRPAPRATAPFTPSAAYAHLLTSHPASPSAHAASPLELGNTETTAEWDKTAGSELGRSRVNTSFCASGAPARIFSVRGCHRGE